MKYINKISGLFLACLLFGTILGLNACTSDDNETVIVPKTLKEYQDWMNEYITDQKALVNNCVVGYNKGDFKVASTSSFDAYKSAYLSALNTADLAVNATDATIESIVAANKTLATPGKAFINSLFISDRRRLNDSIVVAETLNASILVGTGVNQVPDSSKVSFTTAITKAKSTRDASTTIDRQVDEGVSALGVAKKKFIAAIIK